MKKFMEFSVGIAAIAFTIVSAISAIVVGAFYKPYKKMADEYMNDED